MEVLIFTLALRHHQRAQREIIPVLNMHLFTSNSMTALLFGTQSMSRLRICLMIVGILLSLRRLETC